MQTACFAHWRDRWTAAENRHKVMDSNALLADEMERRAALEEEVEMLKVTPRRSTRPQQPPYRPTAPPPNQGP